MGGETLSKWRPLYRNLTMVLSVQRDHRPAMNGTPRAACVPAKTGPGPSCAGETFGNWRPLHCYPTVVMSVQGTTVHP